MQILLYVVTSRMLYTWNKEIGVVNLVDSFILTMQQNAKFILNSGLTHFTLVPVWTNAKRARTASGRRIHTWPFQKPF